MTDITKTLYKFKDIAYLGLLSQYLKPNDVQKTVTDVGGGGVNFASRINKEQNSWHKSILDKLKFIKRKKNNISQEKNCKLPIEVFDNKKSLKYRIANHWKKSNKSTFLSIIGNKPKPENLPPLENYIDANEGCKTQKHLSYRLGVTWLNHKNILTLPKAILQDVKEFRKYRNHEFTSWK
ncbi:MAG: hypothetical protein LBI78_03475 [Campylobacteraceae bacterium]|jgi:hypothetical protein|nr:hypothetical protein [Campylobacteraceae bacterium]